MITLNEGCRLHVLETEKFKSTLITVHFRAALDRATVTARSLLSMVLVGATKSYPDQTAIARELERMYGAHLTCHVATKGTANIFSLGMACANEQYLPTKEGLFKKQIQLLHELLFENRLDNEEWIAQKKRELRERIKAADDNKMSYAMDRALELTGKDDPLGIFGMGYEEDIDGITAADLKKTLADMIAHDTIEIYAVGHFSAEDLETLKAGLDFAPRKACYEAARAFHGRTLITETEKQDITQSKLVMIYECDTDFLRPDNEAMMIFNGLFGAFPHSRLFSVVREQNSLCYSISSQYDSFNGIIAVRCGIDKENVEKVKELVGAQLADLQAGNMSDTEIMMTKMMMQNNLIVNDDDPETMAALRYLRHLVNKPETIAEFQERLLAVTKEDMIAAAGRLKLLTVFFLEGDKTDA